MSRIKGLLCSIKGNQQVSVIIQPLNKKIQQYQKAIKKLQYILLKILLEPNSNFNQNLSLLNANFIQECKKSQIYGSSFYLIIVQLFIKIQKSYNIHNKQTQNYLNQIFQAISDQCLKLSKSIQNLSQKLSLHQTKQQQIIQKNLKFIKNNKLLTQSIQSYKSSFQQVNLIYNMKQKIKRYMLCQQVYNNLINDLQQINQRVQIISQTRQQLKKTLENFKEEINNFVKVIMKQMIKLAITIIKRSINLNKQINTKINESLKILTQNQIQTVFQLSKFSVSNQLKENFVTENIVEIQSNKKYYPFFILNIKNFKEQCFPKCKYLFLQYFNQTLNKIQQRQKIIQKLKNYFISLNSLFDKSFNTQLKQAKQLCAQKSLKIIKQTFSFTQGQKNDDNNQSMISSKVSTPEKIQKSISRLVNGQKKQLSAPSPLGITIIKMLQLLDQQKQTSKNLHKLTLYQIKQIVSQLQQQSKLIIFFRKQFKNNLYKIFSSGQRSLENYKKQFKNDIQKFLQLSQINLQNLQLTNQQTNLLKANIIKRSQFIILLIEGFVQKFLSIYIRTKSKILPFILQYQKSLNYSKQIYEKYLKQINDLVYSAATIKINSQQNDNLSWLDQNKLFISIVKQQVKLKFQYKQDKIQQYKKLKRPENKQQINEKTVKNNTDNMAVMQNSILCENLSPNITDQDSVSVVAAKKDNQISPRQQKKQKQQSKIKFFNKNYDQYVRKKCKFEQDQKFVDQFTCGLADNIIISGRLYITTHRLFFHSHFNSSNIFFGSTKMQIPKTDIKKIIKKYNAVIFDNSISITTINGQIFFTSFIARDKAFDIISKTFQLNHDENVFIKEQQQQQTQKTALQDFNMNIEQQDDTLESDLQKRQKQIMTMIQQDQKKHFSQIQYKNIYNFQIQFPGFNAVKFFKIFQSGQEISMKNKHYDSFIHYFKRQVNKNQQMHVNPWEPNILDYLNPCNIKSNTPLKFNRKFEANVPLPASNIPFMPKYVCSKQSLQLYFISKDKYIIINTVNNSKAPMTDCFFLRGKKIVQRISQGVVKIQQKMKVVFVKKTMMKALIQSKTYQEAEENQKIYQRQLNKYLKYLQNTLIKKNKIKQITNPNQLKSIQNMQNQQNQNEEKDQKNKIIQQKLKLQIEKHSKQNKTLKIILLVSILLNIILFSVIL